jgi:hypothetical protein
VTGTLLEQVQYALKDLILEHAVHVLQFVPGGLAQFFLLVVKGQTFEVKHLHFQSNPDFGLSGPSLPFPR